MTKTAFARRLILVRVFLTREDPRIVLMDGRCELSHIGCELAHHLLS